MSSFSTTPHLRGAGEIITTSPRLRIAYLTSAYPALTHTFVEREVRALRARGVEVATFSVRPPDAAGRLGAAHRQAAQETCYLYETPSQLLRAAAGALVTSPLAAAHVLVAAQRLSPPGVVERIKHFAYACEAIRLVAALRRRRLTHVHVHLANNAAATALLAHIYDPGIDYSLSVHGPADFFRVDSGRLAAKAEGASFVRCISLHCRAQVMAFTDPARWPRYHLVHCGVEVTSPPPQPPPSGPLRLLSVARLEPIKGHRVLLEACTQLLALGVDFHLDVAGDGPSRAALASQVQATGLSEHVRLLGPVAPEEIGPLLERSDALVLCSFMEGVPVVLMEAMAREVAVVATRVGGVAELVEDGVNGLVVDPGSADAVSAALRRLAGNSELRRRLGAEGRKRVLAEFTIEQTAAAMEKLFRRYLSERPRSCS